MTYKYTYERDGDDEGHFVFAHDKDGNSVGHLHVPDEAVSKDGSHYDIGDFHVNEDHRRKGVATGMIKHMNKKLGAYVSGAHSGFTRDGQAFWTGYNKKIAKKS